MAVFQFTKIDISQATLEVMQDCSDAIILLSALAEAANNLDEASIDEISTCLEPEVIESLQALMHRLEFV